MNAVYNSFVEKYAAVNYEDENSELTKTTKKRIKLLKRAGFDQSAVVKNVVMEIIQWNPVHLKLTSPIFVVKIKEVGKLAKHPLPVVLSILASTVIHRLGSFEYAILRALQNIVEGFPYEPLQGIKEHGVINGIIDPIIGPLLSSCQYRLRWPEVSADVRLCRTTRSQRPDAMVSEVDGLAYASCYGYGEVKAKNTDRYGKQLDLARLAIVGKDTIDAHSHNHVLLFQVVGESMTFYLEYLAAEATYIVAKLNRINLPRSITEIEGFTAVVPSLYIPFIM